MWNGLMDNPRERLITCFTAVFPALSPQEAPAATMDTVSTWDSTHHFLLMEVVEEAFGIQMPEEAVGEIDSFSGFENYLKSVD
jgi:acyl carrier protein